MRAEQVFIVSEGAIESPWFFFFLLGGGLPGRSPGRVSAALLSPLMHVGTQP